jgi:hypothetical protein
MGAIVIARTGILKIFLPIEPLGQLEGSVVGNLVHTSDIVPVSSPGDPLLLTVSLTGVRRSKYGFGHKLQESLHSGEACAVYQTGRKRQFGT